MNGTMVFVARLFGCLVTAIGILGAVAPRVFVAAVSFIQNPPVIYGAAVLRVVFGVALIRAARASRAAVALRVLGALIVIAASSPSSRSNCRPFLDWWSRGTLSAGSSVFAFLLESPSAMPQPSPSSQVKS